MNVSPESGYTDSTRAGGSVARPVAREWDDTTTRPLDVLAAYEAIGTPAAQAPKGRATPRQQPGGRRHPTSYWSGPQLMTAFGAAGWGELAGPPSRALCAVLEALMTVVLDHRSARGHAVVDDIAAAARYSADYTRDKLHELEDLELLTWRRAQLVRRRRAGKTQSWFEVSKARVVDLILDARKVRDEKRAERIEQTKARIAALREKWAQAARERNERRRKAWSQHVGGPPDSQFALLTDESEAGPSPAASEDQPPPDTPPPAYAVGWRTLFPQQAAAHPSPKTPRRRYQP